MQIRLIVHNYGGSPYHSPKLHPGPCNSVGIRPRIDRQTHTDTQTRVTTIHFASSTTHAKCNYPTGVVKISWSSAHTASDYYSYARTISSTRRRRRTWSSASLRVRCRRHGTRAACCRVSSTGLTASWSPETQGRDRVDDAFHEVPGCHPRSLRQHHIIHAARLHSGLDTKRGKLAATLWWFTAAPKPLKIIVFWGSRSPQGS